MTGPSFPELAGALKGLHAAWKRGGLVPFVGAGASQAYGLPGWRSLVLELLYESTRGEFFEGQAAHYQRALSSWIADYCGFDLTVLAGAVREQVGSESERRAAFARKLRDLLYAFYKPPAPSDPTILRSIARLARRGELATIITFNFDDLLEQELLAAGVEHYPVWNGNWGEGHGLAVIHAHGFLPRDGSLDPDSVVFAEDDYHDLSQKLFHWSQVEIIQSLRKHTALFVGLSMTDPNLRRLLDLGRRERRQAHWVIQKRREVPSGNKKYEALADIQRRATGFDASGRTTLEPEQVLQALPQALHLANEFDQRLLGKMAVKTIWVDDHGHIPGLIDAIVDGPEPRKVPPRPMPASFAAAPAPAPASRSARPAEPVHAPPQAAPHPARAGSLAGAPADAAADGDDEGELLERPRERLEPEETGLPAEAGPPPPKASEAFPPPKPRPPLSTPGLSLPPPPPPSPPAARAPAPPGPVDPADPQKGRWGGASERNGRKVTATASRLGKSWFSVELQVAATPGARSLEGPVTFHLHDTFPEPVIRVGARDGHARLRLEAYGAFTVGVEADGGKTKLELDLASGEVDAPEEFKLT